jgi:hypothetical protein
MQVAADSRRSTDLIQAIRVPVGRGVVAAVGAGAGASPMYLLDPDLGGVAGRFGSWERRYLYLWCARVVPLDRLGDLSLSVPSRVDVSGCHSDPCTGSWEYSIYVGMAAAAAKYSVGFLAIYYTRSDQPFPIRVRAGRQ